MKWADLIDHLARFVKQLGRSRVERPHVLVESLQRLYRPLLPLVVAPDRRHEAFRDRAAGDPRLPRVLVPDRNGQRDRPSLASLPARAGLLEVLGDQLAKVLTEGGIAPQPALDVIEFVCAQGRE